MVESGEKDDLRSLIASPEAKKQFALALPKHLKPDRFVRIVLTAFSRTPKLLECTKASILNCLLDCSQLGIEPDGRKAHLIPYKDKCTLIIDYKGLVALARRSGEIADIHADVVYENDYFTYAHGTGGKLVHRPALTDKGEPIAAYSFVVLKDGSTTFQVMNIDEIKAIRKRSQAADKGPWVTDWAEMAKKTVFRRHSKWLPVESEKFRDVMEKDYDTPADIAIGKPKVKMPEALPDVEEPRKPPPKAEPKKLTEKEILEVNIKKGFAILSLKPNKKKEMEEAYKNRPRKELLVMLNIMVDERTTTKTETPKKGSAKCVDCGEGVSKNVASYSKKKYKEVVCFPCQQLRG